MTTVGDILDEFFSPFSSEELWNMPENDNYTKIVRGWQPVKDAVKKAQSHLGMNCATWARLYKSDPKWKPTKTDRPKKGAHRVFVRSPPGTDPKTCKDAFIIYVTTKAASIISPIPETQTRNLYTCSIGSFNIYTTVDSIDCKAKKAKMNFWMYNSMSKRSFGRFAKHKAFSLSGMKTQYMWWNWVEEVEWTSGLVKPVPKKPGAGGW